MSEFAMVEELADLIKDNLQCKHLLLSMEEQFIDFLQNDTSPDGIMELPPMNPYNRLLLHRLADIFGFAHESVCEGEDRHLILMRCPETSIPSILVSDILGQHDDCEYQTNSHQVLRRAEDSPVSNTKPPAFQYSLEEREAAYLAARERIFSKDQSLKDPVEQKPRNVPVVARRMIAHALGQRIKASNQDAAPIETEKSSYEDGAEMICQSSQNVNSLGKPIGSNPNRKAVHYEKVTPKLPEAKVVANRVTTLNGRNGLSDNLKEKHRVAAKRMFAHALGLNPTKDNALSRSNEAKGIDRE